VAVLLLLLLLVCCVLSGVGQSVGWSCVAEQTGLSGAWGGPQDERAAAGGEAGAM